MPHNPVHRSIVVVDIARFGGRDDRFQLLLRQALAALVMQATEEAGIPYAEFVVEDRGDSKLLLISASVAKLHVLGPFVSRVEVALRQHNELTSERGKMRMRMAVHAGEVHQERGGWAGAELDAAFQLVNSGPAYHALHSAPEANLAVIVSDTIYNGVVRHGYGAVDPLAYYPVEVARQQGQAAAWVHVPGSHGRPAEPPPPFPTVGWGSVGEGGTSGFDALFEQDRDAPVVWRDKYVGGPP